MRPFRLLQITDCHLGSQPGEKLLGLDTDQSLHDVLQMVRVQEIPDLILATGDISNDAGEDSYIRFIDIVKRYFPKAPLAWLPGNHDEPMHMDSVDDLPLEARHIAGGWNLIFLDSRIPMEEGGALQKNELDRLEWELSTIKLPTMIFLHHQPIPVGSKWLDIYVLKNAEAFFKVVDRFSQVKGICWGHIHQEFSEMRKGVGMLAAPSTCIQFTPRSDEFSVDRAMPGYRMLELYKNGKLRTYTKRIRDKVYPIQFTSAGY